MKDQYFGDINDFRKYGLLRALAGAGQLRVGVAWMLTPDDGRTDGEFRRYLTQPERWRAHDSELHDRLRGLLEPGIQRTVRHAEAWELVPGARYHWPEVPVGVSARREWFESALEAMKGCDLVFFDPDNGLAVPSVGRGSMKAPKFLQWDEVAEAYRRGHSLLLYQHYPRRPRLQFEQELCERLKGLTSAGRVDVFSTAHVAFIALAQEAHADRIGRAAEALGSRWVGEIRHRVVHA